MKWQYRRIHVPATKEGGAITGDKMRKMHTWPIAQGGRGWKQVGYTDMFHIDGRVERLVANNEDGVVDSWEITNGAKCYNNASRHVVYVGGLDPLGNSKETRKHF